MNSPDYFSTFAKDTYSQKGEDGILEKIFELIGSKNKWCVEFGAWDGKYCSNACNLVLNRGWSGVFIEPDTARFNQLQNTYKYNPRVICKQTLVGFEGVHKLDNILGDTPIPVSFDLLSIDVDGNDYHTWNAVEMYKPRVVVIEFNPSIPDDIEFIQQKDMHVRQGCSLLALYNLGKKKGYGLVATTYLNAIFVREEYAKSFDLPDKPPVLANKASQTRLFQLYDGTVMLEGSSRLIWHDVHFDQKDLQILPRLFRKHPDDMHPFVALLFRIWRKVHNWRRRIV
jgi:hypothetical protein